MTLIAFLPILWGLSVHVKDIPIIGEISQGLVIVAIIWAVLGTGLLALAGIRLPGLEFRNQRVEAAYRKELVFGEDHADRAQPPTLGMLFDHVRRNYFRLYFNYCYFNVVRYGNVAGSTGSVIPTWVVRHYLNLPIVVRHPDATRFWVTVDGAVDFVFKALAGKGEVFVPTLPAFRLGDLVAAMGLEHFEEGEQLNPGEKMHEVLEVGGPSSELARRMSVEELRFSLSRMEEG